MVLSVKIREDIVGQVTDPCYERLITIDIFDGCEDMELSDQVMALTPLSDNFEVNELEEEYQDILKDGSIDNPWLFSL